MFYRSVSRGPNLSPVVTNVTCCQCIHKTAGGLVCSGHVTATYLQEPRLTASVGRSLTTSMQGGYLGRTPAASPPPSRSPGGKTAVPVWWRTRCLSWVELRTPHTQSTWHETHCPGLASRTPSVRCVPNNPGTFSRTSWENEKQIAGHSWS